MIAIPTGDELRDARARLAEQAGLDIQRYAALRQEAGRQGAGTYVTKLLLPESAAASPPAGGKSRRKKASRPAR
jgi:hypothetical protein